MALTDKLSAIGVAIREKTGKTDLMTLDEMPAEIASIQTGGGDIEVEPIVLTDNQNYGCAGALSSKYVELFGDKITTNNIINASNMFYAFKWNKNSFPFDVNMMPNNSVSMSSMFTNAKMQSLPKINNACPTDIQNLFSNCVIQTIPDDFSDNWTWSNLQSSSSSRLSYVFNGCKHLRYIPEQFLRNLYCTGNSSSSVVYANGFYTCYVLDEIRDLAVQPATLTSNRMSNMATQCYRLKTLIFATNEDGTPKTISWKSQTLDLSSYVGYSVYSDLTQYGIESDKCVINDATYQALKNDPDWYGINAEYSRYNHDSAVETINSLPDSSAYGTNTIKFQGVAGKLTDGGAINTLTEAEIAVAAAKGWTVSLV